MYWLLLTIVLGIVLGIVLYFILYRKQRERLRRASIPSFSLAQLEQECGQVSVRVERYIDSTGKFLLYPNQSQQLPLQKWLTELDTMHGLMSKFRFTRTTDKPLGIYLLRWIDANISRFPQELCERMIHDPHHEFCVRFTNGKRHFPNHYDCIDNYLLILAGTRKCRLDRKTNYTLHQGDMLYIPSEQEHEFWCDTSNQDLNILLNINFNPPDHLQCKVRFASIHPTQHIRNQERVEYT